MEQKKFALIVKIVSVAAACFVFALAITAVVQFFQIGAAKNKKAQLQSQLNYVAQEKYSLENAISAQKDVNNAKKYAREQLGYIEDGDIIYEAE